METVVFTSFQRGIHVVCLLGNQCQLNISTRYKKKPSRKQPFDSKETVDEIPTAAVMDAPDTFSGCIRQCTGCTVSLFTFPNNVIELPNKVPLSVFYSFQNSSCSEHPLIIWFTVLNGYRRKLFHRGS